MDKIDFTAFNVIDLIKPKNVAAVFEKIPPKREFCDTVTFYRDGRILFTRYCFGESAGVICKMWALSEMSETGKIAWDTEKCYYSRKSEAPNVLYAIDEKGSLYFDDQPYEWFKRKDLKTDKENGYTFFKVLFMK